jgi:hypothetical protein
LSYLAARNIILRYVRRGAESLTPSKKGKERIVYWLKRKKRGQVLDLFAQSASFSTALLNTVNAKNDAGKRLWH